LSYAPKYVIVEFCFDHILNVRNQSNIRSVDDVVVKLQSLAILRGTLVYIKNLQTITKQRYIPLPRVSAQFPKKMAAVLWIP
jgi:hypothetical protein